jgi:hypothetical protein
MINNDNNELQEQFWRCSGKNDNPHIEEVITTDKCPICQKSRPRPYLTNPISVKPPIVVQPKKNKQLLTLLTALNLVSGYTTMRGAAQLLQPQFVGYVAGGAIQLLLFFLLSSRANLKEFPKLKWSVVAALSLLSIYTSFFSYYEVFTQGKRATDSRIRAISAHQNLVSDVFTPLQDKEQELKSAIESKDKQIEEEIRGNRESGKNGCGDICKGLKRDREKLQLKFDRVSPVVNKLKPLFDYEILTKKPQDIFDSDIKAIAAVKPNCLPSEPQFVCLPEKYQGVLDPLNPRNKKFHQTYFDEDQSFELIAPFLKIIRGEGPAIASAIAALLIDGIIISLAIGIEARQKSRKWTSPIEGSGADFLETLSESINSTELTIDFGSLKKTANSSQYRDLLKNIRAESDWIEEVSDEEQWRILSEDGEKKLNAWLVKEKQKQLQSQTTTAKEPLAPTPNIILQLPTRYD